MLQVLNRLPSNETLRSCVAQLLQFLKEVLQKENKDNVLIMLKTLLNLHRNHRSVLRNEMQPLEPTETMKKRFNGFPKI